MFVCAAVACQRAFAQVRFPPSPNAIDDAGLRTGHWTLLYDSAWRETTIPDSAIYYRLLRFDKGKPTGKARDFFRTGVKQWEGFITALNPDVLDGESIHYFENGRIEAVSHYKNGVLDGPYKQYNAAGVLVSQGTYVRGASEGNWKVYYDNGVLRSEVNRRANEIEGPVKTFYANGNPEVVATKIKGNAHGVWEEYHKNGVRRLRSSYEHGIENGVRETFFQNGAPKEIGSVKSNNKVGRWREYDSLGHLLLESEFDESGLGTGTWTAYYPNGKKRYLGTKSNDLQTGWWTFYHENGSVQSEGVLQQNMWEGEWKFYHSNGRVSEHHMYVHDTIHGFSHEYHENGTLHREGEKVMGLRDGVWKEYNENGTLTRETNYERGIASGTKRMFTDDGQLEQLAFYKDGLLDGVVERYYRSGAVSERAVYKNDLKDGLYESYFENGAVQSTTTYRRDSLEGEFKSYHPNGQLSRVLTCQGGLAEGVTITYFANGQIEHQASVSKSRYHGASVRYFANGTLREKGQYANNQLHGRWLFFDSVTGKKWKEATYVDGAKHGVHRYFNPSGKLERAEHYIMGFEENVVNVRDSIYRLQEAGKLTQAMEALAWLERVEKRDYMKKGERLLHLALRARLYKAQGNNEASLKWYKAYLSAVRKFELAGSQAEKVAVHNVAVALQDVGNYVEALAYYDEALMLRKKDSLSESYWSTMMAKLYCLVDAGRQEDATALLEQELIHAAALGSTNEQYWYLRSEAADFFYSKLVDYPRAFSFDTQLVADIEAAGKQSPHLLTSGNRAGDVLFEKSDWQTAAVYYQKASAYAEQNKMTHWPLYGDVTVSLFYCYHHREQLDSTARRGLEVQFEKLLALDRDLASADVHAKVQLAIANYYYRQSRFPQALPYLIKAEKNLLTAGLENTIRHAAVLQTLAFTTIYTDRTKQVEAERYFLHSVAIRKKLAGNSQLYYESAIELAGLYNELGQYQKSIDLLKELEPTATAAHDAQAQARIQKYIAENYSFLMNEQQALVYFEKALTYYEQEKRQYPLLYMDCLAGLTTSHTNLLHYSEAKATAQRAVAESRMLWDENDIRYYKSVGRLAYVCSRFNELSESIRFHKQNLAGIERLIGKDTEEHITATTRLAEVYLAMNNALTALQELETLHASDFKTFLEKPKTRLLVLDGLARASDQMKRHREAEQYYLEAYRISGETFGLNNWITAMYGFSLAQFYNNRNQLGDAERMIDEVVDQMNQTDLKQAGLAVTYLIEQGAIKQQLDKNNEAEKAFRDAYNLARADSANSIQSYTNAAHHLGRFYAKMGRSTLAGDFIARALKAIEKTEGRNSNYVTTATDMVGVYFSLSQHDSVKNLVNHLLTVLEESGSQWGAQSVMLHNYLGVVAQDEHQFDEASKQFEFCIKAYSSRIQPSESELSSLAMFYSNLSRSELSLGHTAAARLHLEESERLRKWANTPLEILSWAPTQQNWANYFELANQPAQAEQKWKQLTETMLTYIDANFYFMSDDEKSQFWTVVRRYFRAYMSFAATRSQHNPAALGEAYNVQLATKALLLNASNKIRKRILSSGDSSLVNKYYRWTRTREHMAQLYDFSGVLSSPSKKKWDSLAAAAVELERSMNVTSEDIVSDKGGERVRWQKVQAQLGRDEAAVEIVRVRHFSPHATDSIYYAALILTSETRQAPLAVFLPNGVAMEGRYFKRYKNALASQVTDTASYDIFWRPIAEKLKDKSVIYLSQDGVYHKMNLNALRMPNGRYLVDEKTLIFVSNTRDVISIKARKTKRFTKSMAALVGFPSFFLGKERLKQGAGGTERDIDWNAVAEEDGTGIRVLNGTQKEVAAIADVLNEAKVEVDVYTDERASEGSVKTIQHPRILHIATHGFFDDSESMSSPLAKVTQDEGNPLLRSGLLLAGASNYLQSQIRWQNENGILTAYEVANLNLDNTDLVVLSACETGQGEVQNGEGVFGLQRAFQSAGAQSVIMSLWKVDDEATRQLMTLFYRHWMSGTTKEKALQFAQLELKRSYPHPYYWAAFVIMEN